MREQESPREKKRPGHHGEIDNQLWEDQMDFGCDQYDENVRSGEYARKSAYSDINEYGQNLGNDLASDPLLDPLWPDERVREKAMEALYRNKEVDASTIEVEVKEGCVYLSGIASSRNEKKAAESCVEEVEGVTDIFNELRLQRLN